MPDTEENQLLYPQPSGQEKGCGFPVVKLVGEFSLATGALLNLEKSSLNIHERILWHRMWDNYREGDVVLADRGFCSLADFSLLSDRGVDCVMRLHQGRSKEADVVKKLGKNDYLVEWKKGKTPPNWLSTEEWQKIPSSILVRLVSIKIDSPGFRTREIIVATTLVDSLKYPASDLAELYRRRWLVELFFRDIKTTMKMDILRCKTPEMIHKEISIFVIAYNLVRTLIWEAASKKGIDPYLISFAGALATIRQGVLGGDIVQLGAHINEFFRKLLEFLARDQLPRRTSIREREPRARKRRPKNYQLLTSPRHLFKEIPHRSKYHKNA